MSAEPPFTREGASELDRLRQRNLKLVEEKAYFQLLLQLMERLNPLSSLEDMIRGMLYHIVESIGGTNIRLWYWQECQLHYVDFLGANTLVDDYDDPMAREAAQRRGLVELSGDAEDALLQHGMLRGSWTWAFPLLMGQDLIGVIKLENLHIHGGALGKYLPIFFNHAALILGNEIRNEAHRQAEAELRAVKERLQLATEAGIVGIWDWDVQRNNLVWDTAMYRLYGRKEGDFGGAYEAWANAIHPDDRAYAEGEIQAALRGEREYAPEFRVVWPDGSVHFIKAASRTFRDAAGQPLRMVGINHDITESKRAEAERLAHMDFLESLDRVNRAIQGAGSLEALLGEVLDEVLDIFACDRVGLVTPCDPQAATWQVVEERARPGWSSQASGQIFPMNPSRRESMAQILENPSPRRFGPQGDVPVSLAASELFHIQSMMAQAIHPKVGPPWEFGIHQCDRARVWREEEVQLFQEIGRRLADGLTSMLIQRESRESERRLKEAEAIAHVGYLDRDLLHNQISLSDEARRIFGLEPGEQFSSLSDWNRRWLELIHPDDRERVFQAVTLALEQGSHYDEEYRVLRPDGTLRLVHSQAAPPAEAGAAGRLLGTMQDITERKQAETDRLAHLRFLESLDKLNRAIQGAPGLHQMMADSLEVVLDIFDCDRAFLLYPCDPSAPTWLVPMERTRPEYPGVLALRQAMPTDPEVAAIFRTLLETDKPLAFGPGTAHPLPGEVADRFGIRAILSMAIRPIAGQAWQFGLHQCSRTRIWTEEEARLFEEIGRRLGDALTLLLAQENLKESERRLKEAEQTAHVGYWERDLEAGTIRLSDESYRIFGLSPDTPFADLASWNQHWLKLIHPEDRDRINQAVQTALAGGPRYNVEYRVLLPDGGIRHVHSQADIPRDTSGRAQRILGTMQDISERKQAEAELEQHRHHLEDLVAARTRELAQARDVAESANRMKSVFLANMSHELRTPLNAILGFAQIMSRDRRIPVDQLSNLDTINRSGRQLLALINDVLEISRIEAGRLSLQTAPCDLRELLDDLAQVIDFRARNKGLGLSLELAPDLPRFIETDGSKLRQILLNLLTNAVKYTEQGHITLAASARLAAETARLDFSVTDSGVGIAAEDLQRIFQPFFQTEYGIRRGEGTGLGLAICREYASLLGGELTVESQPGQGSCFRLRLAVSLAPAPEVRDTHQGRVLGLAPGQPEFRVLVAEDDPDSRRLLKEVLEQTGFLVRAASQGEEAVDIFRVWAPHFIWMDMRMPVLDGYAATRRIRALPGGGAVRIVALTASAFRENRDDILAAGCDGVLSKPFVEERLFEEMGRLLNLHYIRESEAAMVVPTPPPEPPPVPLPAGYRAELHDAARQLDMERCDRLIASLAEEQPDEARQLREWADIYRYDLIAQWSESSNEGETP